MNKFLELKQRKAALAEEATAILSKATTEGRALTPEERSAVKAKTEEAEGIAETITLSERAASIVSGGHHVSVRENILDKPFASFGEQLRLIREAATNPHSVDPRLHELNTRAAAGASGVVPADGGFLVAPQFASTILERANETSLVYSRANRIPIDAGKNTLKIPAVDESSRANGSRWGGVTMKWEGEGDAVTASKPKFRMIELSHKKLIGLMYATDELMSDATALGGIAERAFGEELGFMLDDGCINGDGVGKMLGILQAPCLVTITKENAQSGTFVYANAVKMLARTPPRSRRNLVWFINTDVEPQLWQMTVSNTSVVQGVAPAGAAAFVPAGMNGNATATLLGKPVIPIEQCATLAAAGDVILADMEQYLTINNGGMESAVSMHVRFTTDEMAFRWTYRVDGQPSWNKAVTPYKGSSTISPFVTVEAR